MSQKFANLISGKKNLVPDTNVDINLGKPKVASVIFVQEWS